MSRFDRFRTEQIRTERQFFNERNCFHRDTKPANLACHRLSSFRLFNQIKDIFFKGYGLLRVIFDVVSMSGSRTRFSKCSMSGSPYFVDVELIQIEKNELSCCMFFRSLRCC